MQDNAAMSQQHVVLQQLAACMTDGQLMRSSVMTGCCQQQEVGIASPAGFVTVASPHFAAG